MCWRGLGRLDEVLHVPSPVVACSEVSGVVFLSLGEFLKCASIFSRSCVVLFLVCLVRSVAVGIFRCRLTPFRIVVAASEATNPACLRRGASHRRMELPTVLASFWVLSGGSCTPLDQEV